jgi:DNA-binding FadR family transcriptional regulator
MAGRAEEAAMELAPIKSTRIYEEIVRQVKAMIGEGRLKGGDRLPPERDLAEKFVVSRTSVREALRALESLGRLCSRSKSGSFLRRCIWCIQTRSVISITWQDPPGPSLRSTRPCPTPLHLVEPTFR